MNQVPVRQIMAWLRRSYSADLRALSLMRIGVALVILADLLIRLTDLEAHYTGDGVWPAALVKTFGWKPGYWSFHLLNDTYQYQLFLFLVNILVALSLLAGYRTRIVTVISWVFLVSLHNRNLYVLQGGDDLLRLTLFWGIFLPWGSRYSFDCRKGIPDQKSFLIPQFGYLLLIASVYLFSILLKSSPEWTSEGSAVYFALSLEQLRLPFSGDFVYGFPGLMKFLTRGIYLVELLIPLLILLPYKNGYLRWSAFILIAMLHTGIGLTLYVGLFFIISIVTATGLIPTAIMDVIEKKFRLPEKPALQIIYQAPAITWLALAIATFALSAGLVINAGTVPAFSYRLHHYLQYPANLLRLDQNWGMFSPGVLKKDGWFVMHGLDSAGRQWDLRLNQDYVDYSKPAHIVSMYKNDRWRKLAENMQSDNYTFLRPLYGKYMLRRWNRMHSDKKLQIMNLYFMEKENLPGYRSTPIKKVLYCVSNDG